MELSPGRVCQSCQSICRECGTGTGGTTADLCTDCRRQVSPAITPPRGLALVVQPGVGILDTA